MTIEQYLDKVAVFAGDEFGRRFRGQFRDHRGSSELAMLACPSEQELQQLRRAVAIMTPAEKAGAAELTDQQVATIASDAGVDPGVLAIFFNGYALHSKRVSGSCENGEPGNSS